MAHTARILCCDVVCVPPSETVSSACRLMTDKRVGCVLVAEAGRLVGMVSLSDFSGILREVFTARRICATSPTTASSVPGAGRI